MPVKDIDFFVGGGSLPDGKGIDFFVGGGDVSGKGIDYLVGEGVISDTYHAPAVHFDGSTYLDNTSLTAVENASFAAAAWVKTTAPLGVLWIIDPATADDGLYFDTATPAVGFLLPGARSNGAYAEDFNAISNVAYDYQTKWGFFLFAAKINPDMSVTLKVFFNNTDVSADFGTNSPFTVSTQWYANGVQWNVGADHDGTNPYTGDAALLWMAPGVDILDGDGNIPLATLRKFIDAEGKPVNPSGYPAGGAIFFNGDAATFATNQGTGGAFSLVGDPLTNASTSPSD